MFLRPPPSCTLPWLNHNPPRLNGSDDSSPSAWSCELDIVALLQRRLVKTQTRFGSASPSDTCTMKHRSKPRWQVIYSAAAHATQAEGTKINLFSGQHRLRFFDSFTQNFVILLCPSNNLKKNNQCLRFIIIVLFRVVLELIKNTASDFLTG